MAKTKTETEETGLVTTTQSAQVATVPQANNQQLAVNENDFDFFKGLDEFRFDFESRTKPSDILARGETFDIIDGGQMEAEFEQGEITDLCIFVLEYASGEVKTIFQNRTSQRAKLTNKFFEAKATGHTLRFTNMEMISKPVPKQPQPALIIKATPQSDILVDGVSVLNRR